MKILLTAINAKYIHSNPALYSLRAYAGEMLGREIRIAEYTINHRREDILADLYRHSPDMIAISCYIWNWDMVSLLLPEIPKILPNAQIWLGGPEVTYDAEKILTKFPMVTGIMIGEGEETFKELADGIKPLRDIKGIVYRQGGIVRTDERELTDLSKLPFLYHNLEQFENRIIYYESSRGCPYRCSYCLSSIDKKVRLRSLDIVKQELQFFLDHRVKQVKFVDRTFNCNHEHAMGIWQYLLGHDNGVTNFHFEIEADIISEEELQLLSQMRPGLMQMEIGVQTANPDTLREIRRSTNMDRLRYVVERIRQGHNIHVHLDLIAGLPYEDYESFRYSFNAVYAMKPEQLQLGFLKVLKGAYMHEMASAYEIQYLNTPPYEVLSTKWLPYDKVLLLKEVEEMVETYYNSSQFDHTMRLLEQVFPDAFSLYLSLAQFYREKGYFTQMPARSYRYQVLFEFGMTTSLSGTEALWREVLTYDLYLRENVKSRPDFTPQMNEEEKEWYKKRVRAFYEKEEAERTCLADYAAYDSRQMSKMTHMESYRYPVWQEGITPQTGALENAAAVLFDYQIRDPLTYEARTIVLHDFMKEM
ncbi:MAG: B12-binding domain-containing radical SAM protein [Lachnospiraceae bacterium]|nr:B12-binding domain-containing radical SAM protein [Lachnospiraceae bacterium]